MPKLNYPEIKVHRDGNKVFIRACDMNFHGNRQHRRRFATSSVLVVTNHNFVQMPQSMQHTVRAWKAALDEKQFQESKRAWFLAHFTGQQNTQLPNSTSYSISHKSEWPQYNPIDFGQYSDNINKKDAFIFWMCRRVNLRLDRYRKYKIFRNKKENF